MLPKLIKITLSSSIVFPINVHFYGNLKPVELSSSKIVERPVS